MAPEVTIVIPTHNRRQIIGSTLLAALKQEDVDLEVIVVDDCSTDGTAELLMKLNEPRLRLLRNETNRRQAASRNRGIAEAEGKWIAFLDDDDIWSLAKVRAQLDAVERAGADLAYSTALVLDHNLDPMQVFYPPPPEDQPTSILTSSSVPAGSSNILVRTSLLRDIGGVDESLEALADWDLFIRLLLNGKSATVEQPHVGYVLRPASISAALLERHFSDFDVIEERYRPVREEHGVEMDGVTFSRWLAGGLRRGGRRRDAVSAYLRGARRYRDAGNVARAAGALLGESAMSLAGKPRDLPDWADPAWLDLYRPGGKLARSLDSLAAEAGDVP
ncbi:MAG TPA: glycosyltransferase family 2 protein [Solirubrobacterales bacterium]